MTGGLKAFWNVPGRPVVPLPPTRYVFHSANAIEPAALQVCHAAGLPRCRFAALQVCRAAGLPRCRFAALQVCRAAGLPRCRFAALSQLKRVFFAFPAVAVSQRLARISLKKDRLFASFFGISCLRYIRARLFHDAEQAEGGPGCRRAHAGNI